MKTRPILGILGLGALALAASGLLNRSETLGDSAPVTAAPDLDALLPATIRIHPLTRFVRSTTSDNEAEQIQIACHVELRDQFGHIVKGLGKLRLELYRSRTFRSAPNDSPQGVGGTGEIQERIWEIDLSDPTENAKQYDDFVTRTYLIYLTGIPDWIQRWAAAKPGDGEDKSEALSLRAYFVLQDSKGHERRLEGRVPLGR